MAVDIRLPHIVGNTEKEQIKQISNYLFQLAEQLQWALNNVDTSSNTVIVKEVTQSIPTSSAGANSRMVQDDTQATFAALKPLIIKSADIVNAYYEEINKRLEGFYVAQSNFGTFAEKTTQSIEETSKNTTQQFESMQVIITGIDNNVGSIESSIHNIVEEISYTQNDIIKMSVDIEDLDGNVTSLSGNINDLDGEIKTVAETVVVIDSELKNVGGSISDLDNTLKAVEGNVGQLETNLQDAESGIYSNLDNLSKGVGQLDTELQDVKSGVDSHVKLITEDINDLDTKLNDTKTNIDSELQALKKELESLNYTVVEVTANIKSGLLDYDENQIPVYGLEVGQKNVINGVEVFNKFARFTAGRLTFYDQNGAEVGYISDYKLYISHAEVTGTLKLGGYLVDTKNGLTFKWAGRG